MKYLQFQFMLSELKYIITLNTDIVYLAYTLARFYISKKHLLGNILSCFVFVFGPKIPATLLIDKMQSRMCLNYITVSINNPIKILC